MLGVHRDWTERAREKESAMGVQWPFVVQKVEGPC